MRHKATIKEFFILLKKFLYLNGNLFPISIYKKEKEAEKVKIKYLF